MYQDNINLQFNHKPWSWPAAVRVQSFSVRLGVVETCKQERQIALCRKLMVRLYKASIQYRK